MSEFELPKDASRLGLRYRDAASFVVDWQSIGAKTDYDYVVHPTPGADALEEYGFAEGRDLTDPAQLKEAVEEFQDSDNFREWQDRNLPMMNYLWPCELAYGISEEKAAQLIAEHGGSTCLVKYEIDGEDVVGIGLTGGGMNLAHDLAAAYICCGHCPPTSLMDDALSQIAEMSEKVRPLAVGAADRLVESLRFAADNLEERSSRARTRIEPDHETPSGPSA